ncbi:MAG: fatty acid desaturase, partial [Candidatus Eremiobacteraeota bacterium]|nr:fatty acid desaturase [Candidatus Eremiobacteraeota bacterium]
MEPVWDGPPHPWDWSTALLLLVVHLGALAAGHFFSWSGLAVAVGLVVVSGLGITLGYHRLLTHRSFKTYKWLERGLALAGSLACQGGPVGWVAVHRLHHAHADDERDPHNASRSFWWAHMGWLLSTAPNKLDPAIRRRVAPDLEADPFYRWLDRAFIPQAVLLGYGLSLLGGWPWVVWGMFVRLTFTFHSTWLVNSAAHTFGYRSHPTPDRSTNCWWVAWLTFGEGWHNNHHAYPRSARHGFKPWEIDLTYLAICLLERLGLAWNVQRPPANDCERA